MSTHDHADHDYPDPIKQYLTVFFTLLALLIITYLVYFIPFEQVHLFGIDFSFMNTLIALAIACTKATLVMLVFMHLNHASKLTWLLATAGFFWLSIMVVFTFSDYVSRDHIPGSIRNTTVMSRTVPAEH